MNRADRSPIFNLKAVVRQTGLKPDTLRAWERRYGLPSPQRAESGHRLYSPHDVEVILWLMERQHEGMSIGLAVDLWCQLEAEKSDPLEAVTFSTAPDTPQLRAGPPFEVAPENRVDDLRTGWINACLQFDEQNAENILSQGFSLFPAEAVCTFVLQAGLAEIGKRWHQGEVTVQQEHFASALAIRRLEAILSATPGPYRQGRIMIACPAEEEHTFPPLMLAVLLRRRGYDVIYLGANVPLRSMEATISATRPRLVILTAQQLFTAAKLLEAAQMLTQENIAVAFGGLIFNRIPELAGAIPGYHLGGDLEASLEIIEQILVTPRVQNAVEHPPAANSVARDHFRQHQAEIEADIWSRLTGKPIPDHQLEVANEFMGRNIRASLSLGSLDYIDPDIAWAEEMLVHFVEAPSVMVHSYLRVYCQAVAKVLDDRGAVIVDWLQNLLATEKRHPEPDLTRSPADRQLVNEVTVER